MLRRGFYISIIIATFSIISCKPTQNNTNISKPETYIAKTDYNGTWGLTNYFDTIIKNKELAKYRLQVPTWFAILLKIENDTLISYGSISRRIDHKRIPVSLKNDTLATIDSYCGRGKWWLTREGKQLKLTHQPNEEYMDSTVYVFRKRDDLNYFTKENTDYFIIGKNVTKYFNNQLFKGHYTVAGTKDEVVFGDNGKLTGIKGFYTFDVRNYFGTCHSYKNLDVITFKGKNRHDAKQYNWVFKGNKLVLTNFVWEKVIHKGEIYNGDFLGLGKEKIILKKQK